MLRRSPNAIIHDRELTKLQNDLGNVLSSNENSVFKPRLTRKPHAAVPLETEPIASDADSQCSYASYLLMHSRLGIFDHRHNLKHLFPPPRIARHKYIDVEPYSPNRYPHPYQLEIEQYRYPSSIYRMSQPIKYLPFAGTTAIMVESEIALLEMLRELKTAKEIAIDLEHHSVRTYTGVVSLMQISSREKDWIVDTLRPWRQRLERLNEVFADPNILKVLHGAAMDVLWLQRDFGLYIVGLFDTSVACKALGYSTRSLAFLLKTLVGIDAQKQYQTADWRIRPLPRELFDYARSDTHYLLYIFDNLRNDLVQASSFPTADHEGDKLWDVLQRSSEVALQRYEHPIYDARWGQGPRGWYRALSKKTHALTGEQFTVFRAVHQWRDQVARRHDESLNYIIPDCDLVAIAKAMPETPSQLLSVVGDNLGTIRERAQQITTVIIRAKTKHDIGLDWTSFRRRYRQQLDYTAQSQQRQFT